MECILTDEHLGNRNRSSEHLVQHEHAGFRLVLYPLDPGFIQVHEFEVIFLHYRIKMVVLGTKFRVDDDGPVLGGDEITKTPMCECVCDPVELPWCSRTGRIPEMPGDVYFQYCGHVLDEVSFNLGER